jgi:hypothetical protein
LAWTDHHEVCSAEIGLGEAAGVPSQAAIKPARMSVQSADGGSPKQVLPPTGGGGDATSVRPSLPELTLAFGKVSVAGFGGILPWWRRLLVEDKRWMTADEFNKLFAM